MEKYKILQTIGEGAHGIVFKAQKRDKHKKLCALKKVILKKIDNLGFPVQVLREIKILEYLSSVDREKNQQQNDQQNIKTIPAYNFIIYLHEAFCHGPAFMLSFDFMVSDLSEVIRSYKNPLTIPEIKCYMIQITRAVQFIHKNQFIHRDLKPANILLSEIGMVKLADFGQARIYSHKSQERFYMKYNRYNQYGTPNKYENINLMQYSHQVATRWYRAPELLYGAKEYDRGIDIWAVGTIFAELFTRSPIFKGDSDIEQIISVLQILGPTKKEGSDKEVWPETRNLPDYNKIEFTEAEGEGLESILVENEPVNCPKLALDVISKILVYSASQRYTAEEILDCPFFNDSNEPPCHWNDLPKVLSRKACNFTENDNNLMQNQYFQNFSADFMKMPMSDSRKAEAWTGSDDRTLDGRSEATTIEFQGYQ